MADLSRLVASFGEVVGFSKEPSKKIEKKQEKQIDKKKEVKVDSIKEDKKK